MQAPTHTHTNGQQISIQAHVQNKRQRQTKKKLAPNALVAKKKPAPNALVAGFSLLDGIACAGNGSASGI